MSGVCSVFGIFEITSKPTNAPRTRMVSSVKRSIGLPPCRLGGAGRAAGALVDYLAVAGDARAGEHLVVEVQLQLTLLDHQVEQRLHVARVQARGVVGHARGQVEGANVRHVV